MTSFSELGIGLGLVIGCLLLALVAELYYLLWWKKRISNREVEEDDDYSSNYAKGFLHLICWKKPASLRSNITRDAVRDPEALRQEPDQELGTSKDLLIMAFGEESVESEIMRLHNLGGPPRFLFTIKEETKEDLESDDGKSRGDRSRKGSRTRSMSDLMVTIDTPFFSPLASPRLKSPPSNAPGSYHHHGFNPLFESSVEAELSRLSTSPPPKFKFLRDAEAKLFRRLMDEAEKRASKNCVSVQDSPEIKVCNSTMIAEETEGSFLGFVVGKNRESEIRHHLPQHHSSSSQPLPVCNILLRHGTLSVPGQTDNFCLLLFCSDAG
ncbi:Transmembrane protein [Salix suchowensis]|nr:Transmembrane protein [Salix suchowensis]